MESSNIILCELKGITNSNPEILISYPNLEITDVESKNLIPKFLPYGSQTGDFVVNDLQKKKVLSYIFNIKQLEHRDDLVSISVIIEKKKNIEVFKPILKEIIDELDKNGLLTEEILRDNLNTIFEGIYEEKIINIEYLSIDLSKKFKEIKSKLIKQKPNIKGSFF